MDKEPNKRRRLSEPEPTAIPPGEVRVGRALGMFGIRGEVKILPDAGDPERFRQFTTMTARWPDGRQRPLRPVASRTHKVHALVRFEGVETANDAEELKGAVLTIPAEQRVNLPEDTYYVEDLVGMVVYTTDGEEIGPITEVLELPANDVYVTARGMVPAVKEFVREVDVANRRVVVQPVPGLFEPAGEA